MGSKVLLALGLIVVVGGVGTGYLLSSRSAVSAPATKSGAVVTTTASGEKVVGSTDEKAFPDTATGTLEAGGISNEGTHKLIRDGGPSQTVYLVSSVVDLGEFVGKKVQVWGQTLKASKASWLMDVGRVKISE